MVFPVLLWILILTSGIQTKNFLNDLKSSKAFPLLLFFFLAFHGFSLFYTHSFIYGLSKFYGIIFNLILNILALRFIIVNFSNDIFKKVIEVILILGVILTLISASSGPFISFYDEAMQMKIFGIGLWSHVGFGRYMGFAFLVSLINLIYFDYFRKYNLEKLIFLISFAGLILSGLRSAIVCSVIISIAIILYSLKKKNISYIKIITFLIAGVLVLFAAAYFNNSLSILFTRFSQMFNVFNIKNLDDGAISTRLHIYKNSFELFLQNIFIGRGLGSYYDESLFVFTRGLKYPHNVLIEYSIELGSVGLLFILTLLIFIYKKISQINLILSFVFLYFVLLSMFSYSIPFQTGMFSFIAFISLEEENIKLIKDSISQK